MEGALFVQVAGLILALLVQTAVFFYKVGAAKQSIVSEIHTQITIMKASVDMKIDGLQGQINANRLLVAERYLNRDDFRSAIEDMKRSNENDFKEVKQAIKTLDDRIALIAQKGGD